MREYSKKLLDQVRKIVRLKHYSIRTEQVYVDWIRRFIRFHNMRHPKDMGCPEIETFLTYLAVDQHVAASTQNQALSALLFLYRHVLRIHLEGPIDAVRAKKPRRLPVVLTRDQVRQVIAALSGTHQLMAELLYGSGLRLMECARLRVKDLDFAHRQVMVRDAKGHKDRVTVLPDSLIQSLYAHLRRVRMIHERDLADGHGDVYLPYALARKYPSANREWGWQYVFPLKSCPETPARASDAVTISTKALYKKRSKAPLDWQASTSRLAVTPFATVLPRICSRIGTIFVPFKPCSATRM